MFTGTCIFVSLRIEVIVVINVLVTCTGTCIFVSLCVEVIDIIYVLVTFTDTFS